MFKQYRSRGGELPPVDIVRKQVLERLINQRVQMSRAEQTGIVVSDADIDSAVERIAQQNNLDVSQMRQSLIRDGFSFEEFRASLREELVVVSPLKFGKFVAYEVAETFERPEQ